MSPNSLASQLIGHHHQRFANMYIANNKKEPTNRCEKDVTIHFVSAATAAEYQKQRWRCRFVTTAYLSECVYEIRCPTGQYPTFFEFAGLKTKILWQPVDLRFTYILLSLLFYYVSASFLYCWHQRALYSDLSQLSAFDFFY